MSDVCRLKTISQRLQEYKDMLVSVGPTIKNLDTRKLYRSISAIEQAHKLLQKSIRPCLFPDREGAPLQTIVYDDDLPGIDYTTRPGMALYTKEAAERIIGLFGHLWRPVTFSDITADNKNVLSGTWGMDTEGNIGIIGIDGKIAPVDSDFATRLMLLRK